MVGEYTAEQQSHCRTQTGHRRIHGHCAIALRSSGKFTAINDGRWVRRWPADALQHPRGDQPPFAVGESAESGGEYENRNSDAKDPAASVEVASFPPRSSRPQNASA